MALSPVVVPAAKKKGGGLWGKIAGGIAGAVTGGVLSGGNPLGAVAGAVKGAATGASIGGMAGEAIKPTSVTPGTQTPLLETAMRAEPGAQIDIINQGQEAIRGMGNLSVDERMSGIDSLEQAKKKIQGLMVK